MVAQSALLGAKDSITPLLVTLGAGFINLVLDVGLVSVGKMGISGAALATVVAEIVGGCFFFLSCVYGEGSYVCIRWLLLHATTHTHTHSLSHPLQTKTNKITGTVVLLRVLHASQGPKRHYPFLAPVSLTDLAKFFSFAGPVFFALFGKTVCYTSLGIAAQFTGAIPLAGASTRVFPGSLGRGERGRSFTEATKRAR